MSSDSESALVVQTTAGPVRGRREHGLTAWRGIPYAAPPVGELRFRAPQPPVPWAEVRDASEFGPVPPQRRAIATAGAGRHTPMNEDCLTISVVRKTAGAALKPVMVYLYGGAFAIGSSSAGAYDGGRFAAHGDVVFVGFEYRLGALGWMDFTRYATAERPIDSNLGLRDQIAALTWVRDNIRAFGGDPDAVTVFGESAGATALATLMTVPAARGLFARAILQSCVLGAVYTRERSAGWAARFVELLDAPLLTATPDQLVDASGRLDTELASSHPGVRMLAPVIDGDLLPKHPLDAFRDGEAHPIPLIIGTNADEGTLFQRVVRVLAATPERVDRLFALTAPDAQTGVLEHYPTYPRGRSIAQLVTDLMFWHPAITVATGHSRVAPTWMYRYDFATRLMRVVGLRATHASEVGLVFGRDDTVIHRVACALGGRRAARAAMTRMHGRWIEFARTGAVDAAWPRYELEARRTLIIDAIDRIEDDPRGDVRRATEAWQSYR